MKNLTINEVNAAVNGRILYGDGAAEVNGVSTDTRKITSGQLFFALVGENTDGHKYIDKAYEAGCRACVVSKEIEEFSGMTAILVEDTLLALQALAKNYLEGYDELIKFGITGSTGKTSTKELLYWSLSGKYQTAKNFGNFNNHIGMPLTALSVEPEHQAAIFEMGMGHFGEVDLLADIAKPQIAIITNIGVAHIADLGSRDNILKAKMEITNYFTENSKLIINFDNDLLSAIDWNEKKYRVVKVGKNTDCDYIIKDVVGLAEDGVNLKLSIKGNEYDFHIPIPGVHNGYNGALAIAAAVEAGVEPEMVADTIKNCLNTEKRLVINTSAEGVRVIDDTYNASPDSMRAGIDVLKSIEGKRKIAVLGTMLGMGEDTEKYHREVGEYAGIQKLDLVLSVGDEGKYITDGAAEYIGADKALHFNSKEDLIAELDNLLCTGDVVLIKASRAMGMEKIAEFLLKNRS